MKTSKLIIVDLEATCWEPPEEGKISEITEIGICLVNFKERVIERSEGFFVRPKVLDISDYCTNLTGITKQLLIEQGRYLNEVVGTLKKTYPMRSYPWASWGEYDRCMFQNECKEKGIDYPFFYCHINLKNIHAYLNGLPYGRGMEKALESYGMKIEGRHHSGKDDAYNTARLALKMFERKDNA